MSEVNLNSPVLSVKDLVVKFNLRGQTLTAIRGISLDLYKGESLAIVGESGSGKSVFCKTFMGLLDNNGWIDNGSILYGGQDLAKFKKEKEWTKVRGSKIAMVFQDPMTSLNPLKSIGKQIQEAFTLHNNVSDSEAKARTIELLTDVGIPEPERRYKQYPHEFSGGMRQRVVIAIAMACVPEILICDEPTTALDVTIQAQILDLLKKLQAKYGLTIIYITHDLGVVANVADRIAVMYAGDIIEIGTCEEVFYDPRHPYTWALLSSLPQLGVKGQDLYSIQGTPPNLFQKISGDAFALRNPDALKVDFVARPPYFEITPTHKARTWLLDERTAESHVPEHVKNLYDPEKRNAGTAQAKQREFSDVLVSVRDMQVTFGSGRNKFKAVKGVSFDIFKGETFGLVGESGSGKTTIGRAIIRINPLSGGEVVYKGNRIDGKIAKDLDKKITQDIQMIFQDPMASLNERAKVDYIVSEGLMNVHKEISGAKRKERVDQALLEVGLLPEFSSRFPHEFSGGQRQRIGIARSLIMEPEFIIADEPISALDVSIRAQVLNLMSKLQKEYGLTYLFIAHDLSVMRFICDRIAVIQKGVIVELAETEKLFANPLHPYTRALLSAVPMPDPKNEKSKVLEVFDAGSIENDPSKLKWTEIEPGHFILGSNAEIEAYSEKLRMNAHD